MTIRLVLATPNARPRTSKSIPGSSNSHAVFAERRARIVTQMRKHIFLARIRRTLENRQGIMTQRQMDVTILSFVIRRTMHVMSGVSFMPTALPKVPKVKRLLLVMARA